MSGPKSGDASIVACAAPQARTSSNSVSHTLIPVDSPPTCVVNSRVFETPSLKLNSLSSRVTVAVSAERPGLGKHVDIDERHRYLLARISWPIANLRGVP